MSTYTQPIIANFGAAKTAQGTNVGYTVFDSAGATKIARTTSGITEGSDAAGNQTTGLYRAAPTFDTTWTFPLRIKWDITGLIGVVAEESIDISTTTRLATSGYTAPDNADIIAIKAKTDNLPASPAAVGSPMTLDLTQAIPTSNTAQTVGDAFNAARAQGFGKWTIVGTTLTLFAPDGTTAVRVFTLDSASHPTSRT